MTFPRALSLVAAAALSAPTLLRAQATGSSAASAQEAAKAQATDPRHEARIAWFREAKFGLFIHWGLYSIPAGVWKGRFVPGQGEWIMYDRQIPAGEYAKLAETFEPRQFDAEAWVRMAEAAGMKYIVMTAKHHDGFAMYRSSVSPFNVYDGTPFHRDPLRELSDACARHGMKLGIYYSQSQDWHEPDGAGNTWDFGPDPKKDYDVYLRRKAEPQVRELLTGYGPVCLLWFDTPKDMDGERGQRFFDLVRSLQPDCLIDGRLGANGDYQSTSDNSVPNLELKSDWEVPATLNHTWGYKADDTDWKSPSDVLYKLVDVASKGGNYLLNVGPTAEGVMPQAAQDILSTVGRWLKTNGEAIYGAGRSPFGAEYGEFSRDLKDHTGAPLFLSRTEWRCTTRRGRLYFTIFKPSREGFDLPPFKTAIKRIYLLSDPARKALNVKAINGVRVLQFKGPDPMANVVVLELGADAVTL